MCECVSSCSSLLGCDDVTLQNPKNTQKQMKQDKKGEEDQRKKTN